MGPPRRDSGRGGPVRILSISGRDATLAAVNRSYQRLQNWATPAIRRVDLELHHDSPLLVLASFKRARIAAGMFLVRYHRAQPRKSMRDFPTLAALPSGDGPLSTNSAPLGGMRDHDGPSPRKYTADTAWGDVSSRR
jgi:hypothetical protein